MNALFPAMDMGHPFSVLGYQRTEKISARIHCITQGDVVVNRRSSAPKESWSNESESAL